MSDDNNILIIKYITTAMLGLLLMIFIIVLYTMFKPPVVSKELIQSLADSTKQTQRYIQELRDIEYDNRLRRHFDYYDNINSDNPEWSRATICLKDGAIQPCSKATL